ncbi:hypothetical protein TYRP_002448 [Tyrophagus putrescentiae]|nr:hypothetical protein TYRP_002448 [Tyrophagus putrescentiae]
MKGAKPSLELAEYSLKRDLLGFHQWLLNEDDNKNTDLNFDDADFRRSYAEKIFSLGSSGLQAIWQLSWSTSPPLTRPG